MKEHLYLPVVHYLPAVPSLDSSWIVTTTFILLVWLSKKQFFYKTDPADAVWDDYKEKIAWLGISLKSMFRQTWRGDIYHPVVVGQ
jgi:hypothetical protein